MDEQMQQYQANNDPMQLSQMSELMCEPINLQDIQTQNFLTNTSHDTSSIIEIIRNPGRPTPKLMLEPLSTTNGNHNLASQNMSVMSVLLDYGGNQSVRAQKVYTSRIPKQGMIGQMVMPIGEVDEDEDDHHHEIPENIILKVKSQQLPGCSGDYLSCEMTNNTILNSPVANLGQKLQMFQQSDKNTVMRGLNSAR